MTASLLPPNASATERTLEAACSKRCEAITTPQRQLWDPATCPESLLPWLAWALSVDTWRPTWPVATKRAVIAAAMDVHRIKGTVASVRRAVEALGTTLNVREWWDYQGAPYTARIEAFTDDVQPDGTGLTPEVLSDLLSIIQNTAPVRVHFELEAGARFSRPLGAAAIMPRALGVHSVHLRGTRADVTATKPGQIAAAAAMHRPVTIASRHWRTAL